MNRKNDQVLITAFAPELALADSFVVRADFHLKLVGVVTERDICHSGAAENVKASEVKVEKLMNQATFCCDADDSWEEAERKLHEHQTTSCRSLTPEVRAAARLACARFET